MIRRNPGAFVMTIRSIVAACVIAASLVTPAALRAEEFTLLIYETPQELALRGDQGAEGKAYWQAYADFGKKLEAAGAIRGGAPLVPEAETAMRDGLLLGGYFRIEAPTLEDAQALAAMAPTSERRGRTIVARQVAPASAMMAN